MMGRLRLYGEPEGDLEPSQDRRSQASSVDSPSAGEVVVAYHERTKHHFHRYATSSGYMDWATQPDPFRRYAGALRISRIVNTTETSRGSLPRHSSSSPHFGPVP